MLGFGITPGERDMILGALRDRFDNEAIRIAHPDAFRMYESAVAALAGYDENPDVDLHGEHLDTIFAALQRKFDKKGTDPEQWRAAATCFGRMKEVARSLGVWATEWEVFPFQKPPPEPEPVKVEPGWFTKDCRGV